MAVGKLIRLQFRFSEATKAKLDSLVREDNEKDSTFFATLRRTTMTDVVEGLIRAECARRNEKAMTALQAEIATKPKTKTKTKTKKKKGA